METCRFNIHFLGDPVRGDFSLCSGEFCTGPLPWNATAELIAEAIRALGVHVLEATGGPLPNPIEVSVDTEDLTADETNTLDGRSESYATAYFGAMPIGIVVAHVE